jgi:plastocyanin
MTLNSRIATATAALALTGALALSACGSDSGSDTSSSAVTAPAPGAGQVLKLSADPGGALKFTTDTLTAKSGDVTIEMLNPDTATAPHAIAVEGNGVDQDGKVVDPGGTSTDKLTLKPGTYTFYCPVDNHRSSGMEGTLTVS